jgi:hypothetical protein
MDFSRILILMITLQAFGLGLASISQVKDNPFPSVPPKGMDIADLKSSMDAILGDAKNLIAKAKKAKDPMVLYMTQFNLSLNLAWVEFNSYEKDAFIQVMSEQKTLDTA